MRWPTTIFIPCYHFAELVFIIKDTKLSNQYQRHRTLHIKLLPFAFFPLNMHSIILSPHVYTHGICTHAKGKYIHRYSTFHCNVLLLLRSLLFYAFNKFPSNNLFCELCILIYVQFDAHMCVHVKMNRGCRWGAAGAKHSKGLILL